MVILASSIVQSPGRSVLHRAVLELLSPAVFSGAKLAWPANQTWMISACLMSGRPLSLAPTAGTSTAASARAVKSVSRLDPCRTRGQYQSARKAGKNGRVSGTCLEQKEFVGQNRTDKNAC